MPSSAPHAIYTLSLHDALPIWPSRRPPRRRPAGSTRPNCPTWPSPIRSRSWSASASRPRRSTGRFCRPARPTPGSTGSSAATRRRSEEHTSELQSQSNLVCRLLHPTRSTLFPYTTLFRSGRAGGRLEGARPARQGRTVRPGRLRSDRVLGARRRRARGVPPGAFVGRHARRPGRPDRAPLRAGDRKSTRLNSSHSQISYAVFCTPRDLHSFPTRRSSDLAEQEAASKAPGRLDKAELSDLAVSDPIAFLERVGVAPEAFHRALLSAGTPDARVDRIERRYAQEIGRAHV